MNITKKEKKRIAAAGIGGALPVLINLARINPSTMFVDVAWLALLGWCVQALVLAFIGATVGYYLEDDEKLWKVFTIGMTAPALLTGIINASQVKPHEPVSTPKRSANAAMPATPEKSDIGWVLPVIRGPSPAV